MLAELIKNWKNRDRHEHKQGRRHESSYAYANIPETSKHNAFVSYDTQWDTNIDDIITRYQALESKHKLVLAEIANTDTFQTLQAQCRSLWPDASEDDVKALQRHLRVK